MDINELYEIIDAELKDLDEISIKGTVPLYMTQVAKSALHDLRQRVEDKYGEVQKQEDQGVRLKERVQPGTGTSSDAEGWYHH